MNRPPPLVPNQHQQLTILSPNVSPAMEQFLKPIKGPDVPTAKSTELRAHPYKSKQDLLKEKCCAPRPMGNVFTSSSTGHQVSQGKGGRSTSYFASRNLKLARQFKQPTIVPLSTSGSVTLESSPSGSTPGVLADSTVQPSPQIFRNCSVYINGYMGPLVSDIELKKRLAQHGARVVTNFGRKSVTHVILGPNGLAGGKIQKEMLAKKMGVKYVTVDWALDSLREGKRCVEARYAIIRHEKQCSMFDILQKEKDAAEAVDVTEIERQQVVEES